MVRDRAASQFAVTLSTPVASVTADFYQRTLPQWRILAILGGWAGGCATRMSQSPLSQWGTRPPPIPTATLSLAITGAGWDRQYLCQLMSGVQHRYIYMYIYHPEGIFYPPPPQLEFKSSYFSRSFVNLCLRRPLTCLSDLLVLEAS